ncbi:GH92 family glycosyl hydrolase [Plantibacter sp. YIM 135347]|uniref:GH92 family glycosyl hydrolase n=1 Tax=Plantibacter sp. YIM 135347 TaxID=3423919 RepID=UPI003D32D11B
MTSTSTTARPRSAPRHLKRPRALLALVVAASAAASGLVIAAPANAASDATFWSSFESADPQPADSKPFGQQTNVTGSRFAAGSLLGSVDQVTFSAQNTPNEVAANLADGNVNSKWLAFASAGWVAYHLKTPQVVRGYSLTSADDAPGRDPRNFQIEGSTNGTDWVAIDAQTDQSFSDRKTTKSYTAANETAYPWYRLNVLAIGSGNIVQLADWDINDGTTTPPPASPIVTQVGAGPTSGYNMKSGAGFSGAKSLRYAGSHIGDGEAIATNELLSVDVPITAGQELSYKIFPELGSGLQYAATYAAIDLVLDDGTRTSAKGLLDGNGFGSDAKAQGTQKALYANQWNSVHVDLSSLEGRRVSKILLSYDNPGGAAGTKFAGWIDDVSIAPAATVDGSSLVNYVDTRRGTLSSASFSRGNNIPATAVPNGFNFFTPMTNANTDSWLYNYASGNNSNNLPTLQGIGISHEPSPWMGDRNQLAIMPATSATPNGSLSNRALEFSHNTEIARPDLYSVKFTNGLITEVTPTDHGGVYRFQFPGNGGSVLLDQVAGTASLTVAADGTVSGYVEGGSGLSAGRSRMFVSGAFDATPTGVGKPSGDRANAKFASFDRKNVQLRIATSFISLDQAKKNLDLEVTDRSFDDVKNAATKQWNDRLGVIDVEGATAAQNTTLYSNLYRMNLYPNSQFENTGTAEAPAYKYASPVAPQTGSATPTATNAKVVDGKIYVNNGFWDTYRTVWPAYSALYPDLEQELVDGFVQQYRDSGWVARWSSPGYADLMTGTSSDVAFADAYLNGAIDTKTALEAYDAAVKNATVLPTSNAVGRKGLDQSIFLGYTPAATHESVSWGLEGLTNDYGIGRMAAKLAEDPAVPAERVAQLKEESSYFLERATTYGNLFDPSIGFFRARNADGGFEVGADSFDPEDWGGAFTETNGWNFAFHAPFDIDGLAALYGGTDGLVKKLDQFFGTPETATKPGGYGGVIHEMVEARDVRLGQLGMSNQPSHHIPYLYAAAGAPSKTQAITREILQRLYVGSDIGQGYPGDEDNGEMSAWYVFSALGFYPEVVGSGEYVIGSPLFTKATVHLKDGKDLVINAPKNSPKNVYVQSASFNGKALDQATISTDIMRTGGTLDFDLGSKPSSWGERTSTEEARVPYVDATKPSFGTVTSSDGTDVKALTDDNSRSVATFTTATPTVQWTSASGPVAVASYTITNGPSGAAPSAWTLEGSADGQTWLPIDERTAQTFTWATQTRPFVLKDAQPYSHYRLAITASSDGSAPRIAELELLADTTKQSGDFALTASPNVTGAPGIEVSAPLATLSGGKSDKASDYAATVDYFDGSGPQAATITKSPLGGWAIAAPHTFAAAGTYNAQVTVTEGVAQAAVLATITIAKNTSLTAAFDSVCISDPGLVGNCDQLNYAFDRSKLASTGFTQGTTVAVPGTSLTFDLPQIAPGQPDNAMGSGQTISVDLGAGATQLSVIGTGTEKHQQSKGVLTFSDGTTQEIDLNFGDWTGAAANPLFGNTVVGKSAGRLSGATGSDGVTAAIYSTAPITLPEGKTVVSLTLPKQPGTPKSDGRIHVFAIASDGARTAPTPFAAEASDVAAQTSGIEFTSELATVSGGAGAYTATVNWGDGTATTTGVISEAEAGAAISGTHTYAKAGAYTVTVTADDSERSIATTTTITVDDPITYTPQIAVDGATVAPGATVTITGSGFAAEETVDLKLSSTPEVTGQATTDADGAFTQTIVVPVDAADGEYPLTATGATSVVPATASIRVLTKTPPELDPTVTLSAGTARPGDTLSVSGTGFAVGEQVEVILHSEPVTLGTFQANGDGVFQANVVLPSDAPLGEHTIEVLGLGSGASASAPLTLVAKLPEPGTGGGGTTPVRPGDYDGILTTTGAQGVEAGGLIALALIVVGGAALGAGFLIRRRRNREQLIG